PCVKWNKTKINGTKIGETGESPAHSKGHSRRVFETHRELNRHFGVLPLLPDNTVGVTLSDTDGFP
ncbi:MAG: hypothetical protein U9R19_17500, partial [Bacteroidota bacterium]|nr:hypothetical protein [Bacteroidota bacterium]